MTLRILKEQIIFLRVKLHMFFLFLCSLSMVSSNKISSEDRSSKELEIPKANSLQGISDSSSFDPDQEVTSLKSASSPNVPRCEVERLRFLVRSRIRDSRNLCPNI